MVTLDELTLYFYISCGVTVACLLLLFIMVIILFVKINRFATDERNAVLGTPALRGVTTKFYNANVSSSEKRQSNVPIMVHHGCDWMIKTLSYHESFRSNQLSRQVNMMADFCYTNPTIVPGEELSRRGFSMYNGSSNATGDDFGIKTKDYNHYYEARSKF